MRQENLCLEEYTGFIKQFPCNDTHLSFETASYDVEICYVPAEEDSVQLQVASGESLQISGNNQDGFVVTTLRSKRWR
ncbi:hypothetical protein D3C79_904630 [compost metagenome]